jgi:PKD repeat protein
MKTKKLLCAIIALFFIINTGKAVNTYTICSNAFAITSPNSWHLSTCAGATVSTVFTNTVNIYSFGNAGAYTLNSLWTLKAGSTVNIGSGVNLTITGAGKIKSSSAVTNNTITVASGGTLTVSSNAFLGTNNLTLSAAVGSFIVFSGTNLIIPGGTYGNVVISGPNTIGNVLTISNDFTNSATTTISSTSSFLGNLINSGTLTLTNAMTVAGNVTNSNPLIIDGTGGGGLTVTGDFNSSSTTTIKVSGFLNLNGTVATSAGTISGDQTGFFNDATSSSFVLTMDQTTSGTTNCMNTVQNNGSGTLTLGNALQIAAGGDMTPVSGTINVGASLLTLLASQSNSAAIGNSSGGVLTGGPITSQVYQNPLVNRTVWTTMGAAGVSGASFQQWHNTFPITCFSCIDGCCAGGISFTSIDYYDESNGGVDYNDAAHYTEITTDAEIIPSAVSGTHTGQGVWVYMGTTSPYSASPAQIINTTGTPVQGTLGLPITFTGAANGYNLLANPYPSPIIWDNITGVLSLASNAAVPIDGTAYIYDSFDASYGTIAPNGTGSGAQDLIGNIIPTGMAFYVLASAAGTLNFDETVKQVGGTQNFQKLSANNHTQSQATQFKRFSIQAIGTGMKSQTMIQFDSRASIGIDHMADAPYLRGSEPLYVTSQIAGKDFSINGLPDLNQNYIIPVKMVTNTTGTYTINALYLNKLPSGYCIILHDKYNGGVDYDLHGGPFTVTLTDTETVARFVLNITVDNSATLTGSAFQTTCSTSNNGYITAIGNDAGPWNYTWKDANNNIVKTSTNLTTADSLGGLNVGVYSVDVNTAGTCNNATQSFTITVASPGALSLTTNTMQATCSTTTDGLITAVGNSAGPWNYTWKDVSNNIIQTTPNKTTADTLYGVGSGVYSVEINTAGTCDLGTQSFTLTVPNSPAAIFSTPSATVNVSISTAFTNASTDATSFWWTFGDGGTSNLQNPNYTYNTTGTYTVTLYAFNAGCNDTVSTQQVIIVQSPLGIASSPNGDMMLSKDQGGNFVKFNYSAQTKVNITVYNALGQVVFTNANQQVSNDKVYLNLENAKDQLIFVSVTNLDKNTQVTKKLFNN